MEVSRLWLPGSRCSQVRPPSVVRRTTGPSATAQAEEAPASSVPEAEMSYMSRPSPGSRACQVLPPSEVRRTVPRRPAAQAVEASTAETQSRSSWVPESWGIQVAPPSRVWKMNPPSPTVHAVSRPVPEMSRRLVGPACRLLELGAWRCVRSEVPRGQGGHGREEGERRQGTDNEVRAPPGPAPRTPHGTESRGPLLQHKAFLEETRDWPAIVVSQRHDVIIFMISALDFPS